MTSIHLPRRLLRRVEKPARYTGGEWNSIHKIVPDLSEQTIRPFVRFAFCFPDLYEIGMSNLALRILYDLLNRRGDTWCERVFYPAADMRQQMQAANLPLFTLESRTPVAEMDIIGFTLQYEMCYPTVLDMLSLAGVPQRAAARGEDDPLVVCGGPVVYNIEPMADFFDLVMIGEGEEMIQELLDLYRDWKAAGRRDKTAFLLRCAQIPGIYVPSFYTVDYQDDGTIRQVRPNRPGVPPRVIKRLIADLDQVPFPLRPIVPNTEIVHDRVAVEVFRGCSHGCRFCQAGMIYRPVREKSPATLLEQTTAMVDASGYDEVGLLSLSTGDYPPLETFATDLLTALTPGQVNLSLPSLRLDSFNVELMQQVATTRKAGLTFAPEAGSQRLRDVINKNIQEADLLKAVSLAFAGGWHRVKLYFMLGLPTETEADVLAIAALARQVLKAYQEQPPERRKRRPVITVSTSMFIPKPFTPFQWCGQFEAGRLHHHQQVLAAAMTERTITYQWHDVEAAQIEAVLARGDRRLGPVIERVWRSGGTLESWGDSFSFARWQAALEAEALSLDFYAQRPRPQDEVFPWDHIDCGVEKQYLYQEWQRALAARTSPACRFGCKACGAHRFGFGVCHDN